MNDDEIEKQLRQLESEVLDNCDKSVIQLNEEEVDAKLKSLTGGKK